MSKTNHLSTASPLPTSHRPNKKPQPARPLLASYLYWLLWLLLIALYLAWPLTHLDTYSWSNDEGLYLQRAALTNAGYSLYTEAAFNKPPLLIWLLQIAFKIGGQTLITARLTILALTLMGFIAFGKIAQHLWGRWAGLFAAGLLLALPEIPIRAHAVTSDLPALSFALIGLWAALLFRSNGRLPHLILASLSTTAALLIHPLLIYLLAPFGLILLWPTTTLPASPGNKPLTRQAIALLILIPFIFILLTLLTIDWRTFFQWAFAANVEVAQDDTTLVANGYWIYSTLTLYWPLLWLALVSTFSLYPTPKRNNLLILLIWFLATIGIFLVWAPLWEHYRLFLALPLILVTGGGLATSSAWLITMTRETFGQRPLRLPLTLLMLIGLVLFSKDRWQATQPDLISGQRPWTSEHLAAQAFINSHIPPDAFITTDDPMLAFAAHRLVPPPLTEASLKMINTGFFTLGDAIESTLRYQAPSVMFVTGRLERLIGFEEWVTAVAISQTNFDTIRAYTLPATITPTQPMNVQLGDGLSLQGFTLLPDKLQPGEPISLVLFWQRNGLVSHDYHVFIHIVDDRDQIVAQSDSPPINQDYPTPQWPAGLLLPDPHNILTDPALPPGTYRLIVGMYEWPSLIRLPAFQADGRRWPDDRILLTELTFSGNE